MDAQRTTWLLLQPSVTCAIRIGQRMRRTENAFREIVELAPEGIFIHSDTRFRYLNATALRLFGATSAEQLVGQPVADRLHPNSHRIVTDRLRTTDETVGVVPSSEEKFLRLDGSHFDVECSAAAIIQEGQAEAIVFFRDISGRKQTYEAELRSRALLKAIVEGTTDAVYVKDRECRLLLVNSAA